MFTGSSRSARSCRSPRLLTGPMRRRGAIPRKARRGRSATLGCAKNPARLRRELPGLWRAENLATVGPGGRERGALHGRAADARHGPARRGARKAGENDGERQGGALSARQGQRQFQAPRPNALWVSDFTYVATWAGFVYVAFVIDTFARRIVGWRASRTAHAGFVLDALEQALCDRRPVRGGGLVHHSDRTVQGD